ncbi:MAG: hypothetical protein IPL53_00430 [Ignavibacteria bacterium]|nr:hypothetical protein [Ignavibacteria bacterium]
MLKTDGVSFLRYRRYWRNKKEVIEDINDRYSLQFNPLTNEITGITIRNFTKLLSWYFE